MRDDKSCQAHGKRDIYNCCKSNGQKKTMQRPHLTMNITQVYELFKMEYLDAGIG